MNNLLKIFFISLLITTSGFAQSYEFWVENPTVGQAYFDIFNGIVALFNSERYQDLLHTVFAIGGIVVFMLGVIKSMQGTDPKVALTDFTKYMVAGAIVLKLIYSDVSNPNDNLLVEARTQLTYCPNAGGSYNNNYTAFAVSMPSTLAWFFASVNAVGTSMTDLALTAYQNVNADPAIVQAIASNAASGYGKNTDAAKSLATFSLSDLDKEFLAKKVTGSATNDLGEMTYGGVLTGLMPQFYEQCIFYVGNRDSVILNSILDTMKHTANIDKTMKDLFTSGDIKLYKSIDSNASILIDTGFPYQDLLFVSKKDGLTVSSSCRSVYNNYISPTLTALKDDTDVLLCSKSLMNSLNKGSLYVITGNEGLSTAPIARELALQAGLQSFYQKESSKSLILGQIGYASGYSQSEFITNNLGTGAYMAKMLPYIQMSIRAILYAFFPFVFIVVMLPGGFGVAKNYAQTMIWVELWAPVAVILNYFLSYAETETLAGSISGMNVSNYQSIISDSNMLASVGGYLYMSVPALTYLILRGSGEMLGSLTSGMAGSFAKNFDSNKIKQDISDVSNYKSSGQSGGLTAYEGKIAALEGVKQGSQIAAFGMNESDWKNLGIGGAVSDLGTAATGAAVNASGVNAYKGALGNKATQDTSAILAQYTKADGSLDYAEIGRAIGSGKLGESEAKAILMKAVGGEDNYRKLLRDTGASNSMEALQTTITATRGYALAHAKNDKERAKINKMNNEEVMKTYGLAAAKDFGSTGGIDKFNKMYKAAVEQDEALGQKRDKNGNLVDTGRIADNAHAKAMQTIESMNKYSIQAKDARNIGLQNKDKMLGELKGYEAVKKDLKMGDKGKLLPMLATRLGSDSEEYKKIKNDIEKGDISAAYQDLTAISEKNKAVNSAISSELGLQENFNLAEAGIAVQQQAKVSSVQKVAEIAKVNKSLESYATNSEETFKKIIRASNLSPEFKKAAMEISGDRRLRRDVYRRLNQLGHNLDNVAANQFGKDTGLNEAFGTQVNAGTAKAMLAAEPDAIRMIADSGAFEQLSKAKFNEASQAALTFMSSAKTKEEKLAVASNIKAGVDIFKEIATLARAGGTFAKPMTYLMKNIDMKKLFSGKTKDPKAFIDSLKEDFKKGNYKVMNNYINNKPYPGK